MTDKEVMQKAIDALIPLANAHFQEERKTLTDEDVYWARLAVFELRSAIAQPVQPKETK